MKISEQSTQRSLEQAPLSGAALSEAEQYCEHVASQFTQPFLKKEQLLHNLRENWPGCAEEVIQALVAAGYIEVAPTGRYRLPLPAWSPNARAQNEPVQVTPLPLAAPRVQPAPAVPLPAPRQAAPLPEVVAAPTVPKFKPLRLAVPGRAA